MNIEFQPKIVRAGEGECLNLHGEVRHQLLDGDATDGVLALAHSRFKAGSGAPLHIHTREDEWFFVESGEFDFQIGSKAHSVSAGDFVYGPRGVAHSYSCSSEDGGSLYIGLMDAGFENFFREVAAGLGEGNPFDKAAMSELALNYGVQIDGVQVVEVTEIAAIVIPSKGGELLEAFGDSNLTLIKTGEVEGRFCVLLGETPSLSGPPLHVHELEHETFIILEGRYEFQINDARVQVGVGDVIFAPKGVPHTFRVVSAEPGKALIWATPGGFDDFFRDSAALFASGSFTPEAVISIGNKYSLRFLPPES